VSLVKSRFFSVLYMFLLGAFFAGVLSAIRVSTADRIEDNQKFAESANLVRVFELARITPETTGGDLARLIQARIGSFWIVQRQGRPVCTDKEPGGLETALYRAWAAYDESGAVIAYAFPIGGKGFWGPIAGLLSVEPDGETIRTVAWTRHTETPGLGARIEEDAYREKFRGRLASDPADHRLTVVPEGAMGDDPHKIDQITGATQTTVAGMGVFLNENFADWHRFLPMLRQCAQSAASAEK